MEFYYSFYKQYSIEINSERRKWAKVDCGEDSRATNASLGSIANLELARSTLTLKRKTGS